MTLDVIALGYVAGEMGLSPSDLPDRLDSMGRGVVVY